MTTVNHNTIVDGSNLYAIPLHGSVRVNIIHSGSIVGSTVTNNKGEWIKSFDLEDGTYIVKFTGSFRPIGKSNIARYATNVSSQSIELVIDSSKPLMLSDMGDVHNAVPYKNSVLIGDGTKWKQTNISDCTVDKESDQIITGHKSFTSVDAQSINISKATFGSGQINSNNGKMTLADAETSPVTLKQLAKLSFHTDVVEGTPSKNNILVGTGTAWISKTASDANIVTTKDNQIISGSKTFDDLTVEQIKFTNGSYIRVIGDTISFVDSSGTYSLESLAISSLSDLADVLVENVSDGFILQYSDGKWQAKTASDAGILDTSSNQSVSGAKTFSNVIIDGEVSGTYVDTDLFAGNEYHIATSKAIKDYVDNKMANISSMRHVYIKATNQAPGNIHLSGQYWNTSKALIKEIHVSTASTNWDLYLIQNDNGYATNDAVIPRRSIGTGYNGNQIISVDIPYLDEDSTNEVHLYYLDNSGANNATIIVVGLETK